MSRRAEERRTTPALAVGSALGAVLPEDADPRARDRRQHNRRRGDANSVAETVTEHDGAVVKTFLLGGARPRKSAVYGCGCVAVDPQSEASPVQLLQCPTHAALQAKLRRRQTDRVG